MGCMGAVVALLLLIVDDTTAQQTPSDLDNPWTQNNNDWNRGPNQWDPTHSVIITEATYFVVASRMVRPGQVYKVSALILRTPQPLVVRASIQRDGVELSQAKTQKIREGNRETLSLRIPSTSVPGAYKLRVEGTYDDESLGGSAFVNESIITFSQRSMTIFVQTDKTMRFRAIPISTELRAFDNAVDVYMRDPFNRIMRRWLSRQSNFGSVSLSYQLSDQPVFGEWVIQVIAQGQVEETRFLVEEYYQTRFEVNVTMPAFFFNTDQYIHGKIMANYTSGAPVHGNLTLRATIRPLIAQSSYRGVGDRRIVEKYFNFDEQFPFWYPKKIYNQWERPTIPHLKFFNGVYEFRYPIAELEQFVPSLEGMEVKVTATVGDRFLDEIVEGYSMARIFNSSIKVAFLGGSPQVFKPSMPFYVYLAMSYHDGSPLSRERLRLGAMEVRSEIVTRSGGRRNLDTRGLPMSTQRDGVWEMKVDLRSQLGYDENARSKDLLNDIQSMKISASFLDARGERVGADLLLLSHFSPMNHHIKVSTSTRDAKFTVFINNRKARTGEKVEVAIYGEPGAYVGLAGLDRAFYTMQAQSQLSYDKVIMKMSTFDEDTNGTFVHQWFSHEGNPDEMVYYPSSTYGIDANRTFE
uniref:(California timema) hypothetical protein n=1 Tax=Timema californicum TaxID=61474 RepID=A0A7R9JEQ6_TIMCA|nr:unnamed protein product [Timema californicum]